MTTIYSNGIPVPRIDDSRCFFHNRLTLIIGPTGSGKSALTQHILNSLRNTVPVVIVACPTAVMNGDYNGIIPEQCTYDDLTKPLIQRIFQRQENVVEMYTRVHDLTYITPLFRMTADPEARAKVDKLDVIFRNGCHDIRSTFDPSDVDSGIDDLTERYKKKLTKLMRGSINAHKVSLHSMHLTDVQRSVLNNFNINPSLLLIADDCMATVKEWSGLEETKKLFYQGRHYHISTIMLCQATTLLSPQFRSNAHITIFTTEQVVNSYVKKETSGYSKDESKKISKIAETIFTSNQDSNRPNYKKLALMGPLISTDFSVQYIIGTPRKKRFGSIVLWKICDAVKKDSSDIVNNSFNKMFSIKSVPTIG